VREREEEQDREREGVEIHTEREREEGRDGEKGRGRVREGERVGGWLLGAFLIVKLVCDGRRRRRSGKNSSVVKLLSTARDVFVDGRSAKKNQSFLFRY
jgi:hypothetical protein